MKLKRLGPTQQKLLLLFLGSIAIGLSAQSPRRYFRAIRCVMDEWENIDQRSFNRSLRSLCQQKLLKEVRHRNGDITLQLTEAGKRHAKHQEFFGSTITIKKPKKWDGLWRIILFDVPEKKRFFRDILRNHLKNIGFLELQKSVFVLPFPCEKELTTLVDLHNATPFVRIITAQKIDNEQSLKQHFFSKNISPKQK